MLLWAAAVPLKLAGLIEVRLQAAKASLRGTYEALKSTDYGSAKP
tara:strand:+ start:460 stop:594 length:135 start_codon:yes stop_codon:yes gene_type:complete